MFRRALVLECLGGSRNFFGMLRAFFHSWCQTGSHGKPKPSEIGFSRWFRWRRFMVFMSIRFFRLKLAEAQT
jgi:hypothetical protein